MDKEARLAEIDKELRLLEIEEELAQLDQEESQKPSVGKSIAKGARNLAAGVGDLADIAFTPLEATRYGAKYAAHKLAPKYVDKPEYGYWNSYGNKIAKGMDQASGNYTKSEEGEELYEDIQRGLASLPAGAGIGRAALKYAPRAGAAAMEMFAPNATNVGSIAGGTAAAHNYMKNIENPEDPSLLGRMGAGVLGGVVGGKAGHLLGHAPRKIASPRNAFAEYVGTKTKFSPQKYEQAEQLGLQPSLGLASESLAPLDAEVIMHGYPASADKIEALLKQREGKLATKLGITNPDLEKAVEAPNHFLAKEGAKKYKKYESDQYERLDKHVAALEDRLKEEARDIDVDDILHSIESKYAKGRKTKSEKATFRKGFPGEVHKALETSISENGHSSHSEIGKLVKDAEKQGLNRDLIEKQLSKHFGAEMPGKGASFQTLMDLRDQALELKNATKPGDPKHSQATQMHKLLREKIDNVIESHGTPQEVHAFKEKNRLYAEYASPTQSNMKSYVYKLTGTDNEATAFKKLTTDPKFLRSASNHLDKDQKRQLAEAIMATEGSRQGRFNIATAHTEWVKFIPKVREEFLSLMPSTKAREDFLSAMDYIGKNKAKIEKIANTSKTSHMKTKIQRYKEMIKGVGGLGGAAIGFGTAASPLSALALLAATDTTARVGARIWTDPVFLKRINNVMKAKNEKSLTNHASLLFKTPSLKEMIGRGAISSVHEDHNDED